MTEDKIRIVATDGDDTVTLGFISCGSDYVFGQVTEGDTDDPYHYTYHKNGYMHHKWRASAPDPDIQPQYFGPTLENFCGFVSTGVTAIPNEVGRMVSPDFGDDARGYDNITYIDVRNAEHEMQYQSFICESGYAVGEYIEGMKSTAVTKSNIPAKLSYQIYTEPEPWVGVAHWQQASGIHGLGATQNFRRMGKAVKRKAHTDPYPEPCPNGDSGCDGPDGMGPLCRECYDILDGS